MITNNYGEMAFHKVPKIFLITVDPCSCRYEPQSHDNYTVSLKIETRHALYSSRRDKIIELFILCELSILLQLLGKKRFL